MKYRPNATSGLARTLLAVFAATLLPGIVLAQVPVDENGEIIGDYVAEDFDNRGSESSLEATGNEDIPLLSAVALEELVGPVALYPDDLLAIVLPASAYPLQIVEAARFLEELENDPSLRPDPEWDDSVVALINYPEVVTLLNEDIDWTWRLGDAVVSQQSDVVAAIETFRDRAYAAGNLKSDSYQNVTRDEGIIEIVPIADDVIHVPYYEPERVVVYQRRPVYYYYPRPYPVYYYPYASNYAFDRGRFWGVTTAFSIGWFSDSLSVFHHSYRGHPYYGHSYWDRYWYRRPTVNIHHRTYVGNNTSITINRYNRGDRWQPRPNRRNFVMDGRVTRNRQHQSRHSDAARSDVTTSRVPRSIGRDASRRAVQTNNNIAQRERKRQPQTTVRREREPVQFRDRTRTEQQRTQRRVVSNQRRTQPAVQARRTESTPRVRSAQPQNRVRSSAQQRETRPSATQRHVERAASRSQVRRPEPQRQQATRPAPQRQQATRPAPQRQQITRPAPQRQQASRSEPQRQERAVKQSSGKQAERRSGRSSNRPTVHKR